MQDCIFCKIVKREVGTDIEKETTNLVVFADIHPSAPFHWLIVPKEHLNDLTEVTGELFEEVKQTTLLINKEQNLSGFQLRINYGKYLEIQHFHVHLMAKF